MFYEITDTNEKVDLEVEINSKNIEEDKLVEEPIVDVVINVGPNVDNEEFEEEKFEDVETDKNTSDDDLEDIGELNDDDFEDFEEDYNDFKEDDEEEESNNNIRLAEFTEEEVYEIEQSFRATNVIESLDNRIKLNSSLNVVPLKSFVTCTLLNEYDNEISPDDNKQHFVCVEITGDGHILSLVNANEYNPNRKIIPVVKECDEIPDFAKDGTIFIYESSAAKLYKELLLVETNKTSIDNIRRHAICMDDINNIRNRIAQEDKMSDRVKEKISDMSLVSTAFLAGILESEYRNIGDSYKKKFKNAISFIEEAQNKRARA